MQHRSIPRTLADAHAASTGASLGGMALKIGLGTVLACTLAMPRPASALDLGAATAAALADEAVVPAPSLAETAARAIHLEAVRPDDPVAGRLTFGPMAGESTAPRFGPLRGLTDAREVSPRGLGSAGLYAYLNLGSVLPAHLRGLASRADGGVTFELRSDSLGLGGAGLGSMLRLRMNDGGQFSLRLRGKKIGLWYGRRFTL